MRFYVYRYGSNAANQSMDPGPHLVAEVEAANASDARSLVARRITVYNNQFLEARDADEVDAEERYVDNAVQVID